MRQVRYGGALGALDRNPALLGTAESLRRPARTRLRCSTRCPSGVPRCSVAASERKRTAREYEMNTAAPAPLSRRIALYAAAGAGLAVWVFPVLWGLLTSFKTERDVLAYPPVFIFTPTLANYREVIFGASSILPNLWSSLVVATLATLLTMLFAVPAAYAMARLRFPAKRGTGFYVLATQMLPPVGLIIPYYLVLQKLGALDTYSGLTVIYLTFALPFAIWLMGVLGHLSSLLQQRGQCVLCEHRRKLERNTGGCP